MDSADLLTKALDWAKLSASLACLFVKVARKQETVGTALQRVGWSSLERRKGPVLWFHVNSLGETSTVLPVVYRCLQEYNEKVNVLLTTPCLDVYKLLIESLPQRVVVQLVPLANPITTKNFLRKWRPQVGVFLETPFQQELAVMAHGEGVNLALLNAHMPGDDVLEWHIHRTRRSVLKQALSAYSLIVPRTYVDVGRLRMFGATLGQMPGWSTDLQQASELGSCASGLTRQRFRVSRALLKCIAKRQVWIAANTLPGEDAAVARVHGALRQRHRGLLTIVAPRGVEAGCCSAQDTDDAYAAVARRMSAEKRLRIELLSTVVKSPERLTPDVDVIIVDDPEALTSLYSYSEIVLVGGSLLPSVNGASSPAAAAVAGCALLMGSHGAQYLALASDLNHAAVVASEEAAAAVAQTGATMRGIMPNGFDTPRSSHVIGYESVTFGGSQAGAAPAMPGAFADRHVNMEGTAVGGSVDGGTFGGHAPTWAGLVSEMRRPVLTTRPMSAPPTIPEHFQLRDAGRPSSASPSGEFYCFPTPTQLDSVLPWPGSGIRSNTQYRAPVVPQDPGVGTPVSLGYQSRPSVYRTALSVVAGGNAGASRSRRSPLDRYKWASSQENIGFGYAWSSEDTESSDEDEGADGEGASGTYGLASAADMEADRPGGRGGAPWGLSEAPCDQVQAFQSSVLGQDAGGVSEGRQSSRDLRAAVTTFSPSSSGGFSAVRSEPTFGAASSAGGSTGARAPETASFELQPNGDTDGDSECGSSGFHDALEDDHQDPPGAVAAELEQLASTNSARPSMVVDVDVGSPPRMEINFNDSPIAFLAASASATCVFGDSGASGGDGDSDGEDAPAGSPAFAPVARCFTSPEPNGASAVQPEDRNADDAPGPSAPADAVTATGQDGETSSRSGGKCGTAGGRGAGPAAPGQVAVQLPNAKLAHITHVVMSRDGTCGHPTLRRVADLRRRLRSEPGAMVAVRAAPAPAGDGAAAAGGGTASPPPASAQLSSGRVLAAGAAASSSSPATQLLDSPASFGRGQGSEAAAGAAERPSYRVVDLLDKALPGGACVDGLSLASMMNESTYPGDLALVSGATPPSSAKAERDASSIWAALAEGPQLGSFDHYLQSVRQQSMLSSPPSRGRSGLRSCSKKPDADGKEASVRTEVALPGIMPTAGSLELESDVAFAESPSALDASCSFGKLADVTVLPMPPIMDPVDTPAQTGSPSGKEGKDNGNAVEPAIGAATAAAPAPAADAAWTLEGSDAGAAAAASDAGAASNLTIPPTHVDQQQQQREGAESPNSEFQFPEGSVPDNSGSGSPTLLATPSVHNSSGGALNLLPDGPEPPTGARPGDKPEASGAFAGVGSLGQGHGRPSSHTSSPSTTSSRWHSMAGIDPLTAASSSAGSPASKGTMRYSGQAQCSPVALASAQGSNTSTGASSSHASIAPLYDVSCFASQATCNWLSVSNPINVGAATKDGAAGASPAGVESSSDTLATDFMPNLSDHTRMSLASVNSSSSRSSSGRPGFYPVASIDKWLNSFGSLLAQPSLEVQRSQAAHDPLVWYQQQVAGQQQLSPGGTKVPGAAALEGVASGFRAPMHSPSRPLEDERCLGINPQALASVKTMLFPAAPPPPSIGAPASASAFFRPEVVTLGAPVSPARPSASSSGSSATGVNGAVASPIRQCTVGTDIVTSAFTIGRPAKAASTAAAPLAAPNSSTMARLLPGPTGSPGMVAGSHQGSPYRGSAPQQWALGLCPPDSGPNSADSSVESRAPSRCAQDELSQLLNSPRSPVSSVRVMRTLSPSGRDRRALAKAVMSPGRAEASSSLGAESFNCRPQQGGLESPVGPGSRASGAGATSPGGSAVWPLPVAVPSINTPRRSLQGRLSAPVNQASPFSSPLRSVTSVVGAADAGGAQPGGPSDLHHPAAQDPAATQPPPSPRVGMGHQSQRSSLTDIGPIAFAAGGGAPSVGALLEALPDESIPSSKSSSCPNTPTSRAANNTSSPFRAASLQMDALLCSQVSCNSNTSANTGQTFEESFNAAVKAAPTRSPARAPVALRSANTSPYKLPMPSPFAAAMASSSGGAYGSVFGKSLFAEEEEEAAAMNDFDSEDDMPLSPRANSTNIHFSPKPAKAPLPLPLPPPPLPSAASAAAAHAAPEPAAAVPLETQNCSPPGDGGFAEPSAAPSPGVPLHIPPRLASAGGTDPALMARLHLLSAPTFSRIPSLSAAMDDDGARSKSPSPARLTPRGGELRPDAAGRSPRITFSGGMLAVPAVPSGSGSSLPKSNLSHVSDDPISKGSTPGDPALASPLGAESPPDGDKAARPIPQPAARASATSLAARGTPTSRLATATGGRDESPPRSPADRTSCPRSARPSASPVKPLLQSTQSSPVPNSFAACGYAPLPIMPTLSPRHSAHRPTPATPSSPPPLSPRASTSAASPFSPPASYISPCATDPRASPIKVQTVHKRTPADLPLGTTGETAPQPPPYVCPVSNFEPFGFEAASMAASGASLVNPASSSPVPAERHRLPQPAFGGVSPIRTQQAAAPCPPSPAATTRLATSQPQCIPWLQPPPRHGAVDPSLEEPLLMTRASAPAGMQLLAERRQPPTPRSSLRDVRAPAPEPFDGATAQPQDLYAQRTQQQMMWDRARVESRTASATGTPRSARALFMGGQPRDGAGEPPPLNTSLSSTTCFMADVCVSPVEAPRSPRVATTAAGLPPTHVFAPDGAATAPGGAMSYDNADEESWQVQQVRYMHSSVGRQTTPRPARVLFPTAPAAVGSTATAPPSPSWRQVSRQLFSDPPPSSATPERRSGSIAGSTDPLESVLSGMIVQVASPVSPQPRLLAQPASPRPLASPVKTDTAAASPRADHHARRTTPRRPSSPYLQAALLQRAQQTSASPSSTETAGPPPSSSSVNAGAGRAAAGVDAVSTGGSGGRVALGGPHGASALLRSPGAVVPPPRRALSPPCHGNPGAQGTPTLPHLPPLPPLPRLRPAPDPAPTAVGCPAQVYGEPPVGWLAASLGFGGAAPDQHPPAGLPDAMHATLGTGAEAVSRSLFRASAPQLACEVGPPMATALPQVALPLPGMPTAVEEEALATLECQFHAAEQVAADLPIETLAPTPITASVVAAAVSGNVADVGDGAYGDLEASFSMATLSPARAAAMASAPGCRPSTAPDPHTGRQAPPQSPRARAVGPRQVPAGHAAVYRIGGSETSGPSGAAATLGPEGCRGGGGTEAKGWTAPVAPAPAASMPTGVAGTSQRSGPCQGGVSNMGPGGSVGGSSSSSGGGAPKRKGAGSASGGGAAAGGGSGVVATAPLGPRQLHVPSSPSPAGAGGDGNGVAPSGHGVGRRARQQPARAQGAAQPAGLQDGYGQRYARPQDHGDSVALGGSAGSPPGSAGGALYGDNQEPVPPGARYAGQYLIPAAQLTCDPRVGPAVWIVGNEEELATALGALLRDTVERRSRGRAAAQGAAKLASSLVTTVWGVLEDMVIAPALQQYISLNDASAL